jgi:hypothetical protein
MQREVTVRCEPWAEAETTPGALEIDTVALCGESMSGAIFWALDATDIHSGWTEVRAVWNRGAYATREQLSEIEQALPFAMSLSSISTTAPSSSTPTSNRTIPRSN